MEQQKKYDVFISYSTVDKMIAEGVCVFLESHRIRCFVAYRDIPRGENWAHAIPTALRESRMMLVVFSKAYNKSIEADNEINIAARLKMPILTFRITDDDFDDTKEYFLAKSNRIDAFPKPQRQFGALLYGIETILSNRDSAISIKVQKRERIFISYKRVDKDRVFAIKDSIEKATVEKCWIDLDGIESDAQFVDVIMNAIDQSDVFLFMRSKEHNNITNHSTDWTIREVNYALGEKKRIVFVSLDNTPLPRWFKFMFPNQQEVDVADPENLNQLCRHLCSWLNIPTKEKN